MTLEEWESPALSPKRDKIRGGSDYIPLDSVPYGSVQFRLEEEEGGALFLVLGLGLGGGSHV